MKIDAENLKAIIASHGRWLRDEEGGQRADLSGADLRRADLRGANLSGANLYGANLSDANLYGANFDKKYYQIVRIGSRKATTTYCVDDDNVLCGCWNNYKGGTLEAFRQRVEDVYGEQGETPNAQYYAEYMAGIAFFEQMKGVKDNG